MQETEQAASRVFGSSMPRREPGDAGCFRLLSEESLQRIHQASLHLLETVGVRITTQAAVDLLADAGCSVGAEGTAKIPAKVVDDAIASAPGYLTIYDREGRETFSLPGTGTHFGLGIGGVHFLDPGTGARRRAQLEDVALACRVADALPNIDLIGTSLVVEDPDSSATDVTSLRELEAMVGNTSKPISILPGNGRVLADALAIATAIAGGSDDLRRSPFVIAYLNSTSPLLCNAHTLDSLLTAVDRGIPVVWAPASVAGATGPVTLPGTAALANAEALAGLVLSQLRCHGAPFIMGSEASSAYMKTGSVAFGSPEQGLLNIAAAEMARYYRLPSAGLGCVTSSPAIDQQAAAEQMMSAYGAVLSGVDLVPFVGFLESGLTFSLEAAVMGDEIVGMVRRIMRGMPVDDETLALDVIKAVGPGGNFLDTEHTFRHFRKELWQPSLLCRTTFDSWVNQGSKSMGDRVREKLQHIMQTHQSKPLPNEAEAKIADIIEARGELPRKTASYEC